MARGQWGRLLRWHVQNLNERRDETCGALWRHGRAWLYPRPAEDVRGSCLHIEWQAPTSFVHLELSRGDDGEDLGLGVACGLFAVWLHLENVLPAWTRRFWNPFVPRELSLKIHNRAVWWNLWTDGNEWDAATPRWRRGAFHPIDALLGDTTCHVRQLRPPQSIVVPMPEGCYIGTATVIERTWTRPRWWRAERRVTVDLEFDAPPKFAGKGENSWDQEDDGIFGCGYDTDDIEVAIGRYVGTVLQYRRRRGQPEGVVRP